MRTLRRLNTYFASMLCDESGQNITEYCVIIAFVGTLIAVAFNVAHGSLFTGLSQSYSSPAAQLTNCASLAQTGS